MLIGGGSIAVGSHKLGDKVIDRSIEYLKNSKLTAKDKDVIKKRLLKGAKKQGIKVVSDPEFPNSAYTGGSVGRTIRNTVAKITKLIRKSGNKELARNLPKQAAERIGSEKLFKNMGKDSVVMGNGSLSDVDVLSHELGHAQYMKSGRSKSLMGKVAHKLTPISETATGSMNVSGHKIPVGQIGSFAHGFQAGYKKEKNKQEGKKTNTWNKIKSVAVPAALTAPILIAEGKASLNGLKAMRKAGASKELMNQSRKRLGAAWGTYAGNSIKIVGAGGAGDITGKGVAKLTKKKDKDKKKGD